LKKALERELIFKAHHLQFAAARCITCVDQFFSLNEAGLVARNFAGNSASRQH